MFWRRGGIRTLVGLLPNGFQDFLAVGVLGFVRRKQKTINNAENPVFARVFGVLLFQYAKNIDSTRISPSKRFSKEFFRKIFR